MSFWTNFRDKVLKPAAPITAAFIPGIGPITSGVIGAGIGAATGGGVKGALLGGLTGGIGNALVGGAGGLSNILNGSSGGLGRILSGAGNILKSSATGLTNGLGRLIGGGDIGGAGGGVTNGAGSATGGLGSILSGGGGLSGLMNFGSSIYSGIAGNKANDKIEEQLLRAKNAAKAALQPYQDTGLQANSQLSSALASGDLGGTFTPDDLTQDPGYQFNLAQGQQALDRQQSARGGLYSGAALKAAQDYGQGLADNTYNNAYQRWLSGQQNTYNMLAGQSSQGQNAAKGLGNIYSNIGDIQAGNTSANTNNVNKTLASILSGSGALGQTNTGGMTPEMQQAIAAILARNGSNNSGVYING